MDSVRVKVYTFKDSGKWYDQFYVTVEPKEKNYFHISEAIRNLKMQGGLQCELDWLIGINEFDFVSMNEDTEQKVRDGVFPMLIKE